MSMCGPKLQEILFLFADAWADVKALVESLDIPA
jgi:hypothetical protein